MDYTKQKPLTQAEINYINSKNNLCVINISTYPLGYIHTKIAWLLPINITRNEDSFWFNNYKEKNKENYWVVYPDNNNKEIDLIFEVKQFKDIDEAINYGVNKYKNWLQNKIEYVKLLEQHCSRIGVK